ncbi:hypothetical protein M433DRAFT_308767 [Acidomyces richmondensis BFW]|nr:MAG: hypothetical protein FE78DRAFT_457739 [Acidomyces sp. 'richmondensis']KYG44322.1 hypothetical protein M433DRAFT_308767 [Acidomyces richmondensis BFW]
MVKKLATTIPMCTFFFFLVNSIMEWACTSIICLKVGMLTKDKMIFVIRELIGAMANGSSYEHSVTT